MTASLGALTGGRTVARTVAVGGPLEVGAGCGREQAYFAGEGSRIAGFGVAATVEVSPWGIAEAASRVSQVLGGLWDGGPPPVALAALPFSPGSAGRIVVPEIVLRSDGDGRGEVLATVVGAPSDADASARAAEAMFAREELLAGREDCDRGGGRLEPGSFVVRGGSGDWVERVERALARIRAGELAKVVLARRVLVSADRPLRRASILARLGRRYARCSVFAAGGFVGASPELLVERRGGLVRSRPLAGTVAAGAALGGRSQGSPSDLLHSPKERLEHRLVVDAVASTLAPLCERLQVPDSPTVVPAGPVAHLGTEIAGELAGPPPSALDLVAALHPTPAVAGTPTGAALAHIAGDEPFDRGLYAGPVGWVDAAGDGCFAVGIRSAQLSGRRAWLYAGAGIVEGSDPLAELDETRLKLQPLLDAIVCP